MLVNCAGVNSASAYLNVADDDWQRVIDINLRGTHWGCQIFAAYMAAAGGGSILNIGSVTAHLPLSRVFAYSASKAAVVNLTQNLARELAPKRIRVNALCPGFFPAEQNRAILDEERTAKIMAQTPMARFGRPEELIGPALLLLSDKAGSFITGAAYYVDGGFTAMRL
jgi:NAD(P)-dependent dehydrogenase (short-subunit alcohol dehydrogenase family)